MAICFFNTEYDKKYDCEYEINKDGISLTVNYDVHEEIPAVNGVRTFGANTEFK